MGVIDLAPLADKVASISTKVAPTYDRVSHRRFCEVITPAYPTAEQFQDALVDAMTRWIRFSERLGYVFIEGRQQQVGAPFAPREFWVTDKATGAQTVPNLTSCDLWAFLVDGYFHRSLIPTEFDLDANDLDKPL